MTKIKDTATMPASDLAQRIAEARIHRNESVPKLGAHQRNLIRTLQRDIDLLLAELDRQEREIERLQAVERAWRERFG